MQEEQYWKIGDFIQKLREHLDNPRVHSNTVDGWFKRLEAENIHYINRTVETNEKVYDELDLKIALFIKKRREEKWSLSSIFEDLHNVFDLRPVPAVEKQDTQIQETNTIEVLKQQIREEIRKTYEEMATSTIQEIKKQYEQLLLEIPKLQSSEKQKETRIQDMILKRNVETALEEEALQAWHALPESERMIKTGLFRKQPDTDKKHTFIRTYINEHFEERLRVEMNT